MRIDAVTVRSIEEQPETDSNHRGLIAGQKVSGADAWTGAEVLVVGDHDALERAVANLVENARRHGRGRVTVEAAQADGFARLAVSDEGPGVPDAERWKMTAGNAMRLYKLG